MSLGIKPYICEERVREHCVGVIDNRVLCCSSCIVLPKCKIACKSVKLDFSFKCFSAKRMYNMEEYKEACKDLGCV